MKRFVWSRWQAYLLAPSKRPAWQRVNRLLGEGEFQQRLMAQMSERMGAKHHGAERVQTAEAIVGKIIAEELKRLRWKEAELRTRPREALEGACGTI